jgi:hypothetical protein
LLQRAVDPSGLAGWTNLLNQGVPRSQVVSAITASLEYRTRAVQGVYQRFLGRSADSGGLNAWLQILGQGGTVDQVTEMVVGSAEFFAKSGGNNPAFIQSTYQALLNRSPEPGGAASWNQALNNGLTRTALAQAILNSIEGRTVQVLAMYSQFLHRPADSVGLNAFVAQLEQGLREEDVVSALIGSDEYFAHV